MLLLVWGNLTRSMLVVEVGQVDNLGIELLEKEGTLVKTMIRETGCDGVLVGCEMTNNEQPYREYSLLQDKVKTYEYFVNNSGLLEAETAEIAVRVVDHKDQKFSNSFGEYNITLRYKDPLITQLS